MPLDFFFLARERKLLDELTDGNPLSKSPSESFNPRACILTTGVAVLLAGATSRFFSSGCSTNTTPLASSFSASSCAKHSCSANHSFLAACSRMVHSSSAFCFALSFASVSTLAELRCFVDEASDALELAAALILSFSIR